MMGLATTAVDGTLVTGVVAVVVGLFGGGGLAALLKIRPDRGKVVIEAAQGAVIVQTSVIDDLQDELARVKGEMAALRKDRAAEQARWEREMAILRAEHAAERTVWEASNAQLRLRMAAVEQAADGDL